MPNVAGVRKLLPVQIFSKEWQCCDGHSITIHTALGDSMWTLLARCDSCRSELAISKSGGVRKTEGLLNNQDRYIVNMDLILEIIDGYQ